MSVQESDEFPTLLRRSRVSRGVSQLELASLAGTTQRRVSYLERGREQPGRDVVTRLGESLALSLRERNQLLLAAGYAPAYPESALDGPELAPVRQALQEFLDAHAMFPGIITDGGGYIVAENAAFALFAEGCAAWLLEPPVHAVRLALHPEGMASRIANFDSWAPKVLHNIARSLRLHPDPARSLLYEELRGYVGDRPLDPRTTGYAIPLEYRTDHGTLQLLATYTQFPAANDVTLTELRVETFLPLDHTSLEALRSLHQQRHARH